MNNSLPRLIDGLIATLRREIIPHVEDDFARGQAFGVIYMLNSIKLRASWSNAFLLEQIRALQEASREFAALREQLPGAPAPDVQAPAALPTLAELEAMRDSGNARICDFIDWAETHGRASPGAALDRANEIVTRYIRRQLKWELSTSAKPMFDEISRGSEKAPDRADRSRSDPQGGDLRVSTALQPREASR